MGWFSIRLKEPVKEWCKKQLTEDYTLIDSAIVKRNTFYGAVRFNKTNEIFCTVLLLRWSKDYYNFSYKPMSEFVGPAEAECPKRILKILSPLTDKNDPNGWAKNWRERCWKTIYDRERLCTGNYVVKTSEPVEFKSGDFYQYFKKIGRVMYAGIINNDMFKPLCRVKINLKYYNYELIPCSLVE